MKALSELKWFQSLLWLEATLNIANFSRAWRTVEVVVCGECTRRMDFTSFVHKWMELEVSAVTGEMFGS